MLIVGLDSEYDVVTDEMVDDDNPTVKTEMTISCASAYEAGQRAD